MDVLQHSEVSGAVERLIDAAKEKLVLATPYYRPSARVENAILRAKSRGVEVHLLLRGGEEKRKQGENAARVAAAGCNVRFLERLHAKVYVSEHVAILTSMNLMHASGDDSYEVGAKFERDLDTDLYNRVANQAVEFLSLADGQAAVDALTDSAESQSAEPVKKPIPAPKGKSNSNAKGHCIRCATSIKLDVAKPFCASCYKSWSLYANPAYEEPHCHACGQKRTTSMEKPLCKKCWKELA